MNDTELRRLRRQELLEIMLELKKQHDALAEENERLRAELERERSAKGTAAEQMLRALYDDRFGKGSAEKLLADEAADASEEEKTDE